MSSRKWIEWVYGLTDKSVERHLKQGMPGRTSRGYDLIAIGAWRKETRKRLDSEDIQERETKAREALDRGDDETHMLFTENWELRKDAADAKLAELKLDQQRGMYRVADEVERTEKVALRNLMLMLEKIPVSVATLAPAEIRGALEEDAQAIVLNALKACAAELGMKPEIMDRVLAGERFAPVEVSDADDV